MTKTINRLPAILLAVIIAAALSFAAWGLLQPAYAAEDNAVLEPFVYVQSDCEGYGIPGQQFELNAVVENVTPEMLKKAKYEWEISENGKDFATIKETAEPGKAILTFGNLPAAMEEDPWFAYSVKAVINGKEYPSDSCQVTLTNQYTVYENDREFDANVYKLLPNQSITMDTKVMHYFLDTDGKVASEVVKADYKWNYNSADVAISGKDGKYTVTRKSSEAADFSLNIKWTDGDYQIYYWFDEVDYNLEDYELTTSVGEFPIIKDGSSLALATVNPQVQLGDLVLSNEFYDLKVQKAVGVDQETYDYIYSSDPKDNKFPLTAWPKNHQTLNGVADGGTAVYRLTATGKNGYTGETEAYILIYSDHTLNLYATAIEFDGDMTIVNEYPYLRYEVKKGESIPLKRIWIGNFDNPTVLTPGKDCTVTYLNCDTGLESAEFPTEIGLYQVIVTGKGAYYGSNREDQLDFIKVGEENSMTAKANKLTAKKNKKTTFSASKAFKVKTNGKPYYEKVSGNKKISVSSNGKVTVKKGLKKGKTYSVKVEVRSDGDETYLSASKTVTLKVKVK